MPLTLQTPAHCDCGDHTFLAMKNGVTLVDREDTHFLEGSTFHVNGGYAKSGGRIGTLHRAIMPRGPIVDHINHDKLDNRRRNLRYCTVQQNQFNKIPNARGKSRFKGVSWLNAQSRWIARISLNRRRIWLGGFTNEEDAARAYDAAAKEIYGEFAFLNFPEGDVTCRRP